MTVKRFLIEFEKEYPQVRKKFQGCSCCPMARKNLKKLYGSNLNYETSLCRTRFLNLLNGNQIFENFPKGSDPCICIERIQILYNKYDKTSNILDIE